MQQITFEVTEEEGLAARAQAWVQPQKASKNRPIFWIIGGAALSQRGTSFRAGCGAAQKVREAAWALAGLAGRKPAKVQVFSALVVHFGEKPAKVQEFSMKMNLSPCLRQKACTIAGIFSLRRSNEQKDVFLQVFFAQSGRLRRSARGVGFCEGVGVVGVARLRGCGALWLL